MQFLSELWLPILLSAVFVFVVSSIFHMVIPIHKGDFKKLQNEDGVLAALRSSGTGPGSYMFPCAASMKEMSTPDMVQKVKRGPVGNMTILPPGGFNMGRSLVLWFLYSVIISLFTAYLTWHAIGIERSATYLDVFRIAGTGAMLGYAAGQAQESIWKGVSWTITLKFIFDGIMYGLVTAGTFAWLWPEGV